MNHEIRKAKADIDQLKAELIPEKSPVKYMTSEERSLIMRATIIAGELARQGKSVHDADMSEVRKQIFKKAGEIWLEAHERMKGDNIEV